jgi:hypothetical protein
MDAMDVQEEVLAMQQAVRPVEHGVVDQIRDADRLHQLQTRE